MFLDLNDIFKEPSVKISFRDFVETNFVKEEIDISGLVEVDLNFTNTGNAIWMEGTISADVNLCCSRCLKEYVERVSAKIEERLIRKGAIIEDDVVYELDDANRLDLTEVIRQSLIINVPIKPLCCLNCKGIHIEEIEKEIDPRLRKLREIKTKL